MALNGSSTTEADASSPDTAQAQAGTTKPKLRKPKKLPLKRTFVSSSIGFPYRDLEAGIALAQAMFGAGGVALTSDQLAGILNLTAGTGNFMLRTSTARMFGLVSYVGGKYELTNLGFSIVDKDERTQRQARKDAFLTVPLYKRAYDEFRGKPLPPRPDGLERAFVNFGVSPKQKEAARQIFDKSAQQAGFFASGNDRLIEPIIGGAPPPRQATFEDTDDNNTGGPANSNTNSARQSAFENTGAQVSGFHPFIQGLLDRLPAPDTTWTMEGRKKWLQAAAHNFDLLYKGNGEIHITAKEDPEKP